MDGRKEQTQRADSFCGRQAVKPAWLQSAYCANWSMEKSRLLSGVFFLLYIFICAVWILDFEETAIHTNDLTRDISGTRRSQETNKRSRIFAIPKTLQGYLLYLNVATFHYHGICHICMDDTRGVSIYGDPIGGKLTCGCFRHHVNTSFARCISDESAIGECT